MTEYPSNPQRELDPLVVREVLAGYAVANEVIEAERREQLARMTTDEALRTWRDLVSSFNARPELHEGLDQLDLWQIEGLLTVRRAFDRLAAQNLKP